MEPQADPPRIAVVTGRHPFDVVGFQRMCRSFSGMEVFIQHMEDFVSAPWDVRKDYDAVAFYNMHTRTPGAETDWWDCGTREALERLGETNQGIVLWHHALLAYPEWPLWSEIAGMQDRAFTYHGGQQVRFHVVERDHAITQGVDDWEMEDETYHMGLPGADCHALIATGHPLSMPIVAWTRMYRNARVFCYQSGHDNMAYAHPTFRRVVRQGLLWCAGRADNAQEEI